MPDPAPSPSTPPAPALVALAGWLLPGAGYWLIGQRGRGVAICITVLTLFALGILIGGVRVVEAPDLTNGWAGNPFSWLGWAFTQVLQKPWFIGQFLVGPLSLAAAWWSHGLSMHPELRDVVAHARLADIATLYTAVAGMMNLLATIDAAYRAGETR